MLQFFFNLLKTKILLPRKCTVFCSPKP